MTKKERALLMALGALVVSALGPAHFEKGLTADEKKREAKLRKTYSAITKEKKR